MQNYIGVLHNSPLFHGLDAQEVSAMLGCLGAATAHYPNGAYVLREGDRTEQMGLLLSGCVLVVQEDFWGNRNLRARILPGQVFAEAFACVPGAVLGVSAVADEASTVLWLGVGRILHTCPTACTHHTRMIRNLLSSLASNQLRTSEKLTHITRRTTREKLLSYLSAEARRQGSHTFTIPFNRQQLADYLSVERSAMSAELSKMQRDGLLTVERSRFSLN